MIRIKATDYTISSPPEDLIHIPTPASPPSPRSSSARVITPPLARTARNRSHPTCSHCVIASGSIRAITTRSEYPCFVVMPQGLTL